jgi:hypothetical protein
LHHVSKLALVIHLLQDGFVEKRGLTKGSFLAFDGPAEFYSSPKLSPPRSYFLALAKRDEVREIFGEGLNIYHRLTDSYYLTLLRIQCPTLARKFRLLVESMAFVDITDKLLREFSALDDALEDDVGPQHLEDLLPMGNALELGEFDPGTAVRDEASRRIAIDVLLGVVPDHPVALAPIKFDLYPYNFFDDDFVGEVDTDEAVEVKIYFDNCTATHGNRRAWATCPNKLHKACFKYVVNAYHIPFLAPYFLLLLILYCTCLFMSVVNIVANYFVFYLLFLV